MLDASMLLCNRTVYLLQSSISPPTVDPDDLNACAGHLMGHIMIGGWDMVEGADGE